MLIEETTTLFGLAFCPELQLLGSVCAAMENTTVSFFFFPFSLSLFSYLFPRRKEIDTDNPDLPRPVCRIQRRGISLIRTLVAAKYERYGRTTKSSNLHGDYGLAGLVVYAIVGCDTLLYKSTKMYFAL